MVNDSILSHMTRSFPQHVQLCTDRLKRLRVRIEETMQTLARHQERVVLPSGDTPTDYYNMQADLGERLPPPLDPQTKQPANPATLERIFAKELIRQEISAERYIRIPEEVRDA